MDDGESVVSRLADLMVEYGLESASIESGGVKVAYSRLGSVADAPSVPSTAVPTTGAGDQQAPSPVARGTAVNSPAGGIFYSRPSPSAAPFVEVGTEVSAGDVIGILEAMKVFNEITSTVSGKVVEIVAKDGQLVNPGDPLVLIS